MADTPIFWQKSITLPSQKRGFHVITNNIDQALSECPDIQIGLLHIFLQHTSASLCISERACTDVRYDLESSFNRLAPEDQSLYKHTLEGDDDMPAHIKNVMLGCNLTIPLRDSQILLGHWQGIFLCEHRNQSTPRHIVLTAYGK